MKSALLLALSSVTSLVEALGQEPVVTFNKTQGAFRLAGYNLTTGGQVLVSNNDYWGVLRAANDLASDFTKVTGVNYTLSNGQNSTTAPAYEFAPVNNQNNTFVSVPYMKGKGRRKKHEGGGDMGQHD